MVDIIHICPGIQQLDQIFNDLDHIFFGQHPDCRIGRKSQFFIQLVTPHISQVVALVREEQFIDNITGSRFVRWFRTTQLSINMHHCFFFRVTGVFLQCIVYNGIICQILLFLMQQNRLCTRIDDRINMFIFQNSFPIHNDFVPFDRNHLSGVFIHEIFHPGLQYTRSQPTANDFFQSRFGNIYFIRQIEYLQDILICFKADSTQQSSYRQFFLPVDVSIHHIIDVRSELDP